MKKVFISNVEKRSEIEGRILDGLNWVDWNDIIKPKSKIFIKPNFTYPFYKPGVSTSPKVIEAILSVLAKKNSNIIIGESNGGINAWQAEEAFEGHNLYKIADRFGAKLVNLSRIESEHVEVQVLSKKVQVELPSLLLHDIDVFITVPVPKVHVNTKVSLGFKNQWGCIPDTNRFRSHIQFSEKIVGINKLLKPKIAIFDGSYFLNRTGPMDGDPIRKDLLIISNDIGAGSLICCEIMGIDPESVRHFRVAKKEMMFPYSLEDLALNTPISPFIKEKFYLKRNLQNYIALGAFNSRFGTDLLYVWPWSSKPLHKLLYLLKGKPKDLKISY